MVAAQTTQAYKVSVDQWHQNRIKDLKQEDGWLNLEGLFWLHQGVNRFGNDAKADCYYNNANFPKYIGDFILKGDSVVWVNKIDHGAKVNQSISPKDNPITVFKKTDNGEVAATFSYKRFKWVVIKREDKIGIRFRNLDAKTLTTFKGIERFPIDAKWKIKAVLEKPQENFVMITNVLGQTTAQKKAGILKFEVDGKSYSLDVIDEGGKTYFITFADATSGKTTYAFSNLGLNTYTVSAVAIGAGGSSSDAATNVEVLATYNPPAALIAKITTGTWRVPIEDGAHMGVGPYDATTGVWWTAGPGDKSTTGMSDDTYKFNADGTFTAGGQYRVVSTITPVGTPAITESEIIIFEPSPGSYTLDSIENTITFMSQDAGLLEGTFNVIVFNETTFTLNQQIEETMGDLTVKANVNLSLERK